MITESQLPSDSHFKNNAPPPRGERGVRGWGIFLPKGEMMEGLEDRVRRLEEQMAELLHDKFLASFPKHCRNAGDALELMGQIGGVDSGFYCRHCLSENGQLTKLPIERKDIPGGLGGGAEITCPGCRLILAVQ